MTPEDADLANSPLSSPHLLGLEGRSRQELEYILQTADSMKEILARPIKQVPTLTGITVANLFFEPSTRTRISFELAERRLSATSVSFSPATSSVKKGETLRDTAQNIEAMKVDAVVIRHASAGAPVILARALKARIINAGDGAHEHPTQGLLDMYTIREHRGNLDGAHVVIVGDILHSRVAMSNIYGLQAMGARVTLCGPATLIPREVERLGVAVSHNLDEVIPTADVLMILRIQLERQAGGFFPSIHEYHNIFGLTLERMQQARKDALVMHPGPINRGIEIDSEVADGPWSVILNQVSNGVAIRMAVLYLLCGGLTSARE